MKASEEFSYNENNKEYIIKLKPRKTKWLLLLLLLLLPLLLLIKFNKDVVFKTVDNINQSSLPDADVQFYYIDRNLIDLKTFKFFTKESVNVNGKTDANGLVVFENIKYSLYSKLFFGSEKTNVIATGGCFMGDSLTPVFHKLKHRKEELLVLNSRAYNLDFQVLDAEDKQPIPDSEVFATVKIADKTQDWNETSNSNGIAELAQISYCSDEIIIIAQKYGYQSDTLISSVEYLTADLNLRTLYLEPIKEMVDITILDLNSKEPVPNATAKLIIQNDTISFITNTNGVGKGIFDSIKIVEEMQIYASHIAYHDTLSDVFKVEDFVSFDADKKIVYIRPKSSSLSFRDIDGSTGVFVVGASNEIYVNSEKTETLISNANGVFIVPNLMPDDKVTVYSSKLGYNANKTTIINKKITELTSQTSRDIPLNLEPPPPTKIEPPTDDCRAHFSGTLVSDNYIKGHISTIYVADEYGEYVGAGEYPSNKAAFPKAVARTFDGIAIDAKTRVVIYSEPNFQGSVVLDLTGPAVINNIKWKDEARIMNFTTKTFAGGLEANFPKSSRIWSAVNMNDWDTGSLKVICD